LKIDCLHGFFIFREVEVGQVSDFMSLTGLSLVKWRDAYTFEAIKDAPDFSIIGKTVLGVPATETFEGGRGWSRHAGSNGRKCLGNFR